MIESKKEIANIKCIDFPLLAMNVHSNKIVLFTENTKGVVVHKGRELDDIGSFRKDWMSCFDSEFWQILPAGSSVTITQI